MIQASIDIGTNTVLLLVAGKKDDHLEILLEEQRIPRLGKHVDSKKNLDAKSITRVVTALKEYQTILERFSEGSLAPVVTATSAVRDAANRQEFMELVYQQTGWRVTLLSGDEEARATFRGALSVLGTDQLKGKKALVLDIGGGSTEFALGNTGQLIKAQSLDMGSVRFSERYFSTLPPAGNEIGQAVSEVKHMLNTLQGELKPGDELAMVGVAGTVTSIAAIEAGMAAYNAEQLNGMKLRLSAIQTYRNLFETMAPAEIETTFAPFLTDRGEIILAGLIILEEAMKFYGQQEILVSTGGIRHGMLL